MLTGSIESREILWRYQTGEINEAQRDEALDALARSGRETVAALDENGS